MGGPRLARSWRSWGRPTRPGWIKPHCLHGRGYGYAYGNQPAMAGHSLEFRRLSRINRVRKLSVYKTAKPTERAILERQVADFNEEVRNGAHRGRTLQIPREPRLGRGDQPGEGRGYPPPKAGAVHQCGWPGRFGHPR